MRIPINRAALVVSVAAMVAAGCSSGTDNSDSVTIQGDIALAYVKRPISTLGNPTDSIMTGSGGNLFIRDKSSPSATETNITGSMTLGVGDVSDPEVSFDGTRILFAMHCAAQSAKACLDPDNTGTDDTHWRVWEYDTGTKQMHRILCDAAAQGDDVDPAYLPDGRIVFVSNRQEGTRKQMEQELTPQGIAPYTYVDEYERERVTALHVMNADGSNCTQISFNQSHDRNPTVLSTGEIMYSRWDHVGERNQFSIFKINPDGTNPFIVYGAHSPGNSYLNPREMPDGRVLSTVMPLSRTREGGSLEIIDITHYSDNDSFRDNPDALPPPNQLGQIAGQFQVAKLLFPSADNGTLQAMRNRGLSPLGRYATPYPLWDGTNRALVVFTPSQPVDELNALGQMETVEGTPKYGIYMLDLNAKTLRPVVPPQDGFYFSDPVPLQARPVPQPIPASQPDPSIPSGLALIDVGSVYDTDRLQRMGDAVLAGGESIPRDSTNHPDIARLKHPVLFDDPNLSLANSGVTPSRTCLGPNPDYGKRVARFFRITKAVPTPPGLSREVIGETEFEMQQIVGYGVVQPDGSIRAYVPADTPFNIEVLDKDGRGFTPHTNWIQARPGERRFCKGCHSSRLTTTTNAGFLSDPNRIGVGQHLGGTVSSTMARTRSQQNQAVLNLRPNITYVTSDMWAPDYDTECGAAVAAPETAISITYAQLTTPAPTIKGPASCATTWSAQCSIAINYPEHIQPIWDAPRTGVGGVNNQCTSCHSGPSAAAGIDLSAIIAGATGRNTSYDELLVGDPLLDANGLPIITINSDGEVRIEREDAPVEAGAARSSRLIERIFGQTLKATASSTSKRAFCRVGGASCLNGATYVDHSAMLNPSEKRLISEWADLGAQYYNDPFDGTAVRSSAAQLSEDAFACKVQPILQTNCASCHQPFGGNGSSGGPVNANFVANRFVLTGNTDADFSVTASMVTDLANPDASLLLLKPSRISTDTPPHPDLPGVTPATPVMPVGTPNYNTLREWITGSLTCP